MGVQVYASKTNRYIINSHGNSNKLSLIWANHIVSALGVVFLNLLKHVYKTKLGTATGKTTKCFKHVMRTRHFL